MYAYCLFCLANQCVTVARFIRSTTSYTVIQPTFAQRQWVKGVPHEVSRDLLPGYLFLFSEQPIQQIHSILQFDGVIRFLSYGRDEQGAMQLELTGDDYEFAMGLYRCDGQVNAVRVYHEGELLRLSSGLFGGMEGEILRVDHQRKRLQLRFTFKDIARTVWVGYDVVEAPADGFKLPEDANEHDG